MTAIRSWQEIYDLLKAEVQAQKPDLTDWYDGSILDLEAGVAAFAVSETVKIIIDQFKKTYFNTADGPEITAGPDDLQTLAVDHFGDTFARPGATKSTGTFNFARTSAAAGNCLIAAGTIVKTPVDANGNSQRFRTISDVTMTGTAISASILAVDAGTAGNVLSGKITVIETALTDPTITGSNPSDTAGGAAAQNDATYRQTIKNLISTLSGATKAALKAKALTVAGIVTAEVLETMQTVIQYNIASGTTTGPFFYIPRTKMYVADVNGNASSALLANVKAAIDLLRAGGVQIDILAAQALSVNWTLTLTLNPSGTNYSTLQSDTTMIKQTMKDYINTLGIGVGFIRATAEAYVLAVWGAAGTNDLTAAASTIPSGDVSNSGTQKLIPGTIATA